MCCVNIFLQVHLHKLKYQIEFDVLVQNVLQAVKNNKILMC